MVIELTKIFIYIRSVQVEDFKIWLQTCFIFYILSLQYSIIPLNQESRYHNNTIEF